MPRNKKVDDDLEELPEELEESEEVEEESPSEKEGDEEVKSVGKKVPKQTMNFDDKWIKEHITEPRIAQLLKAKRDADSSGDKKLARKIRKSLREAGFYVSKNRED